jgi:tetratricopeptide (TPR) repeat protein
VPVNQTEKSMMLYSGGLSAGLFLFPLSRFSARVEGYAGVYQAAYGDAKPFSDMWYGGAFEAGFRFSPSFILSGNAGYRAFLLTGAEPLYDGIFAGITAQFNFDTAGTRNEIGVELVQDEPVYPVLYALYRQCRLGTLRVTNNESAEIRNVRISFRAGSYTSSLFLCGEENRIAKRRTVEIPLLADFSNAIFNFAENGRMPGEIIIEYDILGARKQTTESVVVSVYNRNTIRWQDPSALAVLISPTSPEILDYSKYLIGIARNHLRTGLNRNMQFAIYLFDGMRASGIRYSSDNQTPYAVFHADESLLDYVQYPFQTLAYRSGDYDDLGLLYAALLSASGIDAAIVPAQEDFLVAFSLDITEAEAPSYFENLDNLLVIDDLVWMVVSFNRYNEGFVTGWIDGIGKLYETFESDENAAFILLSNAWETYPPASVPSQDLQYTKPEEAPVIASAEFDMQRYIMMEFNPKIAAVMNDIRQNGPSVSRYNSLGVLYIRAGMLPEARTVLAQSARMGSSAAMINLGNLALLDRDYVGAEQWFRQALQIDPGNKVAQDGMTQVLMERE